MKDFHYEKERSTPMASLMRTMTTIVFSILLLNAYYVHLTEGSAHPQGEAKGGEYYREHDADVPKERRMPHYKEMTHYDTQEELMGKNTEAKLIGEEWVTNGPNPVRVRLWGNLKDICDSQPTPGCVGKEMWIYVQLKGDSHTEGKHREMLKSHQESQQTHTTLSAQAQIDDFKERLKSLKSTEMTKGNSELKKEIDGLLNKLEGHESPGSDGLSEPDIARIRNDVRKVEVQFRREADRQLKESKSLQTKEMQDRRDALKLIEAQKATLEDTLRALQKSALDTNRLQKEVRQAERYYTMFFKPITEAFRKYGPDGGLWAKCVLARAFEKGRSVCFQIIEHLQNAKCGQHSDYDKFRRCMDEYKSNWADLMGPKEILCKPIADSTVLKSYVKGIFAKQKQFETSLGGISPVAHMVQYVNVYWMKCDERGENLEILKCMVCSFSPSSRFTILREIADKASIETYGKKTSNMTWSKVCQ